MEDNFRAIKSPEDVEEREYTHTNTHEHAHVARTHTHTHLFVHDKMAPYSLLHLLTSQEPQRSAAAESAASASVAVTHAHGHAENAHML